MRDTGRVYVWSASINPSRDAPLRLRHSPRMVRLADLSAMRGARGRQMSWIAAEFDGLLHQCNDPDCHVPGFVSTLTRKPTAPDTQPAPASGEGEALRRVEAASDSDRRDVAAWLRREADERVKFFPQRRDGVDALMRDLADMLAALGGEQAGDGDG